MVTTFAKGLVHVLPTTLALAVVRGLATRTQRPRVTPRQQEALAAAEKHSYGAHGQNAFWSWGKGPLVVFVHGWNGCAAQLAPLAQQLAGRGFRCIALDVTGHGESAGTRTSWSCFLDDVVALSRSLNEPVLAYVGHSAGGLAVMAARELHGLAASKFVCICAPSHPYPPINVVRQRLNPPPAVIDRYKAYIAAQFHTDWKALEEGAAFRGAGSELLLIYDATDRFVDHRNGHAIKSICPDADLVELTGYGHSRIVAAPEVYERVGAFLGEPATGDGSAGFTTAQDRTSA